MGEKDVTVKSRYVRMSDGYTRLYLSDQSIVSEHRYIMEKKLGRELSRHELVHHKDGNRGNNNPDNLELMTKSAHELAHSSGRAMSSLVCAHCGEQFQRESRFVGPRRKKGQKVFYCSKRCCGYAFGGGRSRK